MKRTYRAAAFRRDETGAVMLIAAFGLILFLGVASLVTDLGLRYYQKSRLQNALDSAALASVTFLPDKVRARTEALNYVQKNGFDTASVTVEFPEEGVVRVRDTYTCRTLFAGVFSEDKMQIDGLAAAKYLEKNLSIDFDYLMFYGEDSTFFLNGDFREVAGSIFGNGNIRVGCNDAAVIYDIVSARDISFVNNMSYRPTVENRSAHQDMPDWDEMIMSIAPKNEENTFTSPHSHLSKTQYYRYKYTEDNRYLSNVYYMDGSYYCSGNLNTVYSNNMLYIRGDLYVGGNFTPQCPVYVTGNVYVGGNFTTTWGMAVTVGGQLYVAGNTVLQGITTVNGELYCGGDLTIMNGSGTSYKFGNVYCMGNFRSMNAWDARVTVNGELYVYGKLALGGGRNILNGGIHVWGHGCTKADETCYVNGHMELNGDVFCKRGIVAFGGNGDCVIRGFVYAGDSIETRSGGDISLSGCMIAEGDIRLGGASHTYNDAGATLSLYSRKGNVVLGSQGSELRMWGIVYAPEGDIKISTNGLRIFGSLVGNTITCDIGCGFYIGRNDRTLPFAKTVRAAALVE